MGNKSRKRSKDARIMGRRYGEDIMCRHSRCGKPAVAQKPPVRGKMEVARDACASHWLGHFRY
jgi:hypothetical protein